MRASEFLLENSEEPTRITLGGNQAAKNWIAKVYQLYPMTFQNNHVMLWGEGEDQQMASFELTPSFTKRGAVEVKWISAYPQRQGVGSKAMKELQRLAQEDNISLTLFPWDKGQVSQSKLTKFYKGQGFKPTVKGAKTMFWEPSVNEEAKAAKYNGLIMKYAFNDSELLIKAFDDNRSPLAFVRFVKEKKELYPQNLWTHDDYRNRGIAKSMYDFLKSEGYIINRSHDQTKAGAGFWDKHRGEDAYVWEESEVLDEMPLPVDWDPAQMQQQSTSFKSRLAYALERAKKLGTGSSRVATTIEYQGRPTVLKIAKNAKGLSQNSVEADILSDGYASQLGILIPIIDYDEQNREPSWIHTEMATKANEKQLCHLMKCDSLNQLIRFADTIAGKYRGQTAQSFINNLINDSKPEQEIDIMTEYANVLADLANSFDVELGDFDRAANWGLYKGKPVIIDVGLNSNVLKQYYSR